jgi:hypothetical protein
MLYYNINNNPICLNKVRVCLDADVKCMRSKRMQGALGLSCISTVQINVSGYYTFISHHLPAWSHKSMPINTQGFERSAFCMSFPESESWRNFSLTIVTTGVGFDISACILGMAAGLHDSMDVAASISVNSETF